MHYLRFVVGSKLYAFAKRVLRLAEYYREGKSAPFIVRTHFHAKAAK